MMIPNQPTSNRKTIAVLGAQLSRAWGAEFMSGVMDAANAHDMNVIYFVGGKPIAIGEPQSGGRSYGLYDLIKPGQFDGILLAADIGHTSPEDVKNFCRVFAPTPIASFAVKADGVTTFMADNDGGMRAMMRHLIEAHGYKRIAFIRGKVGQIESDIRFNAYKEELKAHDIRYDDHLVLEGDFTPESGRNAARRLLDDLKIRVQAIVASNDRMAIGAIEVLQQRGIQIPESIAVTGFDDISESQSVVVPLTTVRQSFYDAGKLAVEALITRMKGEKVEEINTLPTELVVRWSCGCLPESIKRAEVRSKEVAQTGRLENKRDAAIRALFGAAGIAENSPQKAQYQDVFGRTWDILLSYINDEGKSESFLKMIQATVEVLQHNGYEEPTTWHNVVSMLRTYALGGISSTSIILRAENLFQQARMLVGELSQRAQALRRLQFEQQEEALSGFGFSMAPAMTLEEIGEAIAKHFPALGLERWYVMFYSNDVGSPGSISSPTPDSYRLILQYDNHKFQIPQEKSAIATGRLIPRGKTPEERRYTAIVMPLSLASNRFGFMWAEIGSKNWDVYLRLKNLLSSALLRAMLVQQREQAQKEVERLLGEARDRAVELARARDAAERSAEQNAKLYENEQARRHAVEALARSSRQLSSLATVETLPQQILEQLQQILPYDCGVLYIADINGEPQIRSQRGLPEGANLAELQIKVNDKNLYDTIARKGEILVISDTQLLKWSQPEWMPRHRSWLGVPLYSKDQVIGVLAISRAKNPFTEDDSLLSTTFAMQATVALENARLYDEVTGISQMMERMVSQRVEELNNAYNTLAKHDKNKSAFIQVAAHELRTPLTVIKGYLGMLQSAPAIKGNEPLAMAIEGVLQGTNRLHQIVNSMLDVARLDSQVVSPHVEPVSLSLIARLVHKDYVKDLEARHLNFVIEENIKDIPPLLADPELFKKALDHVIVNAIKFTPDGGTVIVSAELVDDRRLGKCAEIRIKDTGIGIDEEHHKIIFEKLYQLGKVELHSSSRTNYKGGGAGLGLAIAQGIIKALNGQIWVESAGHDEENFPGSTFFIRLPVVK